MTIFARRGSVGRSKSFDRRRRNDPRFVALEQGLQAARTPFGRGHSPHLLVQHMVIRGTLHGPKNADRFGKFRIRKRLNKNANWDSAALSSWTSKSSDDTSPAKSTISGVIPRSRMPPLLAEDQRLAVLQLQRVFGLGCGWSVQ